MFVGFNLNTGDNFDGYNEYVEDIHNQIKASVEENLDKYIGTSESLDATKIQEEWFPTIDADIFLSHSHDDEKLAINFAGWLYKKFGLIAFIDSCVWGYADNLLRKIDNKYCKNKNNPNYNYDKRNYSTSHVHMMLSTALTKMIDKTECIIFLNTSNSTIANTTEDLIKNKSKTNSPWIYNEIMTSKLIRRTNINPERKKFIAKSLNENVIFTEDSKKPFVEYNLDFEHLVPLNNNDLNNWRILNSNNNKQINALDTLYYLKRKILSNMGIV